METMQRNRVQITLPADLYADLDELSLIFEKPKSKVLNQLFIEAMRDVIPMVLKHAKDYSNGMLSARQMVEESVELIERQRDDLMSVKLRADDGAVEHRRGRGAQAAQKSAKILSMKKPKNPPL